MARCKFDIPYWFNMWVWTYDPRLKGNKVIPFNLFPQQELFIAWLQERERLEENGLVEKSRAAGATFIAGGYSLHRWIWTNGFSAGFGSRKLDLVDTIGDMDSIFEKVRFMLRNLPRWMAPQGFSWRENSSECKLLNPANGSSITGEGGDEIGRGGRKSVYFVDEFAFVEHPGLIDAALSQNTNCRIDISTPNGNGNAFYKKRHSGNVPVFRFHWKDDPRKNGYEVVAKSGAVLAKGSGEPQRIPPSCKVVYPWYEREKFRINDPVVVAQELDIDYAASVEGVCIPAKWVAASINLLSNAAFRAVFPDYVPHGSCVAGLDVSGSGKNRTVFIGRRAIDVFMPLETDQNGTATAHWAIDNLEKIRGVALHYDANGVGYALQSSFQTMERPVTATLNGVLGGGATSEAIWANGKTSKEMFYNRRSEIWHKLRGRFEKTFEFVSEGVLHPPDEMISIPNCLTLIAELSVPLRLRTETGKWLIESKLQMAKRGVGSPDYADALAYSEEGDIGDWSGVAEAISQAQGERFSVPEIY